MKSIRRRLTIWLLGGLAILWLAAGAGILVSVRYSFVKSLDAQLAIDAPLVRFAARGSTESDSKATGGRRLGDRMPDYDDPNGDVFFQTWSGEGEVLEKSRSLGEMKLEFPGRRDSKAPYFTTMKLPDGRKVRTMTFGTSSGGKGKARRGPSTITTLGKETAAIDEELLSISAGIGVVGVVIAFCAIFLVRIGVHRGLLPLQGLARQTRSIHADNLDARFDDSDAPEELQPIYEHLNDLMNRLENSFERERRFSSDLAHEMRTPIAELKMLNEVALKWEDQAGEKTHRESLAISARLEESIETLLALARCESGEIPLRSEDVDVARMLEECWSSQASLATERDLQLSSAIPDAFPRWKTDPIMLRHILGNLLSNAATYAPEGSTVTLAIDDSGDLAITNLAPDLSQEDVGKLFDRYWRADSSRQGETHAGLGLSLAAACAKACGLRLEASLEDGWLTFLVAGHTPRSAGKEIPSH